MPLLLPYKILNTLEKQANTPYLYTISNLNNYIMNTTQNNSEDQFYQFDNEQYDTNNKMSAADHSISDNAEPDYGDDLVNEELDQNFDNENLGSDNYQENLGNDDDIDNEFDIEESTEFDNDEFDEESTDFDSDDEDSFEDEDDDTFEAKYDSFDDEENDTNSNRNL